MNFLVSGATGFIGHALCHRLADDGHRIYALYRNNSKLSLLVHPNIVPVKADLESISELAALPDSLDGIFHLAAHLTVWPPEPEKYFKLNAGSVSDILKLAQAKNVRRVVLTSTAGVLGPSLNDEELDEDSWRRTGFFNNYESSKFVAEDRFLSSEAGMVERVIVLPSRVYGPGLLSESNAVTSMILKYMEGRWRIIPGDGRKSGNYVYIDAVVDGHIAAMMSGRDKHRYILGGENISFNDFFATLARLQGRKRLMIRLPVPVIMFFSHILQALGNLGILRPAITPAWARKYLHHYRLSSRKAVEELGMPLISFEEGARRTIEWSKGLKKNVKGTVNTSSNG